MCLHKTRIDSFLLQGSVIDDPYRINIVLGYGDHQIHKSFPHVKGITTFF